MAIFQVIEEQRQASCSGTFDNAKPVTNRHPMNKFTRPTARCYQVAWVKLD
ncbi:hypothetical protein [Brucella tritici]|uniref:hypothetical protein n=1 Tax=Brucella tritici TaxID=94626 RepID=UPI00159172D3|nr:hypothetical protein [Brucella tritici]